MSEIQGVQQTNFLAAKARAKKLARDKVKIFAPILGVEKKIGRISIKDLRSRWGSCSSQGNLNFHYKLILIPEELADYIVVHELAHLLELNHSHRFWSLVKDVIPDYKKKTLQLRRIEREFITNAPRIRKKSELIKLFENFFH